MLVLCEEHNSIMHADHDATGLIPASFSFAINSSTFATCRVSREMVSQIPR